MFRSVRVNARTMKLVAHRICATDATAKRADVTCDVVLVRNSELAVALAMA